MRLFREFLSCSLGFGITFTGLILALCNLFSGTWEWSSLAIFVCFYPAMALGTTVGFHRYGTHRTITFTPFGKWSARVILLMFGNFTWQGPFGFWVETHRKHHRHTDTSEDPHSPVCRDPSWEKKFLQFLWAHMFWIPFARTNMKEFFAREQCDWFERFITAWYFLVGPVLGVLVTFLLGGFYGVAWYLAAAFIHWHMTGCVNSLTHLFGSRRFETNDGSTNNWFVSIFTLGEGWHNNHHRWQTSARLAYAWWEYLTDGGWWLICLMKRCGLVHKVQVPTR